jgi:hypothetical protein
MADPPRGQDPSRGLRSAIGDWSDPSRTDIVTKPSGLRSSDERWAPTAAKADRSSDPGRLSDYGRLSDCERLSDPGRRSDYGSLSIHARRSEVTPPFIPAEDDPTVRVPPEITEALLGGARSYRERKADDPGAALVTMALELDNPTVVDGWANVARSKDAERASKNARPRAASSRDAEDTKTHVQPFPDEATDVDFQPTLSEDWLPPAPRIPAEFARTAPPALLQGRPPYARGKRPLARMLKLFAVGALLTAGSFLASRASYDPVFRARAVHLATTVWQAAEARLDLVREPHHPAPAPPEETAAREEPAILAAAPATPTPEAPAGTHAVNEAPPEAIAPSEISEPSETPRDPEPASTAAEPASAAEAPLKVLQIEDLPLAPEEDEALSPGKSRKKRVR